MPSGCKHFLVSTLSQIHTIKEIFICKYVKIGIWIHSPTYPAT